MNLQHILDTTFINDIKWFPEIASTNSYIINTEAELSPNLLVGANTQTAGRGRGANQWWAADGALTFSILIEPQQFGLVPSQWPMLSLTVGLSVCEAINEHQAEVPFQLKWPNDVYSTSGKKLCGVLIETLPSRPECLVIGIGVNVNNSLAEAPVDIRESGIALIDFLGTQDPTEVLKRVLNRLEMTLKQLATEPLAVASRWRASSYLTGRTVTITDEFSSHVGSVIGIDDDGALRLQSETGEQRIFAGVVSEMNS